ncbi:hypothetical protein AHAS_Ahas02G0006500 [Arachis hypogaea]
MLLLSVGVNVKEAKFQKGNIRNLGGMRNSYLISHLWIIKIQPILTAQSWTQNPIDMVDLWVKPRFT